MKPRERFAFLVILLGLGVAEAIALMVAPKWTVLVFALFLPVLFWALSKF